MAYGASQIHGPVLTSSTINWITARGIFQSYYTFPIIFFPPLTLKAKNHILKHSPNGKRIDTLLNSSSDLIKVTLGRRGRVIVQK